jgi:hypothetical protein
LRKSLPGEEMVRTEMYRLLNVSSRGDITVAVEYGGNVVEFVISSIISKRNKDELDPDHQFMLLNSYVDYKGEDFKKELFKLYVEADDAIVNSIPRKDLTPLPYEIAHPILDMFDIEDVFNYIKHIYRLKVPNNLKEEFDMLIEQDGRGSRVQTYLKDDYLEFAALAVIIKSVMGPLGQFAYVKQKDFSGPHKEYLLFYFISSHRLFATPAMLKLFGWVEKLVVAPTNDNEADAIRIIERQIPKSEMSMYILAIVVIQKISIATLVNDNEEKNIITRVYNFINNKLRNNGDVSKSIRDKTVLSDPDSGEGDKESVLESYRMTSSLAPGHEVEMDWSVSNIHMVLAQMPISLDIDMQGRVTVSNMVLIDALAFCRYFFTGNIHQQQINLLAIIFKDIIDPRGLAYIRIEGIINLLSIGFIYLWGMGYKNLALLLTAYVDNSSSNAHYINITVNRSRLSQTIKDDLGYYFPYNRVVNAETSANLVEESINEMTNDLFGKRWIPTAYDNYVIEVLGEDKNINKILPSDLKIQLAEFIIQHERLRIA